ncbi:hypothetical protein QVD17_36846 [Tagetes erecta]|uniref:Uncharacterized protein n=1 Tax=Tagetes erecta TaxID=13708 RepID=A0AAD8NJB4_TARER|nr:hypothetical protein QVD17_36846 [Tagetes erecta]
MEKFVLPYDIKYMKMIMLHHEQTFKQQVYELHRLYQIQKIMMKNMQRSMQDQNSYSTFNKQLPQKQDPVDEGSPEIIVDESDIELTLAPPSYTKNKPTSTQRNSDSIATFSSNSSTDSSHKSRVTVAANKSQWLPPVK